MALDTISLTFIKSIVVSLQSGVNTIGLLYTISLPSITVSLISEEPKIFLIFNLLTITSVVEVPISTPILYISSFNIYPHPQKIKKETMGQNTIYLTPLSYSSTFN